MKFYVYRRLDQEFGKDHLHFVSIPSEYAKKVYDPSKIGFTGVMIEADTLEKATKTYFEPTSGLGEYYCADEPEPTKVMSNNKKEIIEQLSDIADLPEVKDILKEINKNNYLLCSSFSKLADMISKKMNRPDVKIILYEIFRDSNLLKHSKIKFIDPNINGDTTSTR